jgi:hypothetical protein
MSVHVPHFVCIDLGFVEGLPHGEFGAAPFGMGVRHVIGVARFAHAEQESWCVPFPLEQQEGSPLSNRDTVPLGREGLAASAWKPTAQALKPEQRRADTVNPHHQPAPHRKRPSRPGRPAAASAFALDEHAVETT